MSKRQIRQQKLIGRKTNRKGEVKRNRKGEVKTTSVNNIEKGILADGQNLILRVTVRPCCHGEGQPSETGVEAFALKLSSYIGKEVGGAYFSGQEGGSTNTQDPWCIQI